MSKSNEYDIIIENIWKEFQDSMSKSQINKWEVPKYSGKQIKKAGRVITSNDASLEDEGKAIEILNNWRAAHAYPLHVITTNLRQRNKDAIVVQRLKRLESITGKIKRFPEMNLYRMQDLGGCRVIVDSIDDVYRAVERYKKSRVRHILKREDDYITNPKESGYRSYHMVYQFQSDKKTTYNKNMLIEIQFRTKLQHMWATAVEMMGIYTKSNLKSSQGDSDTLKFFNLVSSVFAKMENMPICPNTPDSYDILVESLREIDGRINIVSTLSGLNVAIDYVSDKNKNKYIRNGYYVLILDYKDKLVRVRPFKQSQIEIATRVYNRIESNTDSSKDAVLVSANSFDSLRTAYPNYFADISEFISMMRRILA